MSAKTLPKASKPGVLMKNQEGGAKKSRRNTTNVRLIESENGDEMESQGQNKRIRVEEPFLERQSQPSQVGVYLEAMDGRRLSDVTIARTLHKNLLKVQKIFSKGKSQLLVKFSTTADANRLINHPTVLDEIKCKATLSVPQTSNRGIVRGVPIELGEDELLEELNRHPNITVLATTRVTVSQQDGEAGQKVPTQSVILDFPGHTIPSTVYFFQAVRTVQVYITKPLLCYKCQRFGHIAKQCKSRLAFCGHCTLNHDTRECPKRNDEPLCVNCDGAHSPRSLQCPVMQQKFHKRMEDTLTDKMFQPKPNLFSSVDFPDNLSAAQSSMREEVQEPKTLPKAAQRNRLRQFSEVLASRTRTEEETLVIRKKQYKKTEQLMPRQNMDQIRQNKKNTQHKKQSVSSRPEKEEDWYTPQPDSSPQVGISNISDKHLDNLMLKMLSNKRALQLLITILSVIINATMEHQASPSLDIISDVQKQIYQALEIQREITDSPEPEFSDAQEGTDQQTLSMDQEDG